MDFCCILIRRLLMCRCDPADVTLQRARDELGSGSLDLFHLRCEQFATFCKTGHAPNVPKPTRPTPPASAPPPQQQMLLLQGAPSPCSSALAASGGGALVVSPASLASSSPRSASRTAYRREPGTGSSVDAGEVLSRLSETDEDTPRSVEGATPPRRETAALALDAGSREPWPSAALPSPECPWGRATCTVIRRLLVRTTQGSRSTA